MSTKLRRHSIRLFQDKGRQSSPGHEIHQTYKKIARPFLKDLRVSFCVRESNGPAMVLIGGGSFGSNSLEQGGEYSIVVVIA